MAGIKRNDKQYDALVKVNKELSDIKEIDKLLMSPDSFLVAAVNKKSINIMIDGKDAELVKKSLQTRRARYEKEILSLVQKHELELSIDETRLLLNTPVEDPDEPMEDQ